MMNRRSSGGFTLIELSIVLVIIGLLAGGILVGRDLIIASQARATIAQIEKFKTAFYTFQSKYNCLPGDCLEANNLGLGGKHGNGNYILDICSGCDSGLDVSEPDNFWRHLKDANLIGEELINYVVGIDVPKTKSGDAVYLVWYTQTNALPRLNKDGHAYWALTALRFNSCGGNPLDCPALTPDMASRIDTKLDDNLPYSGSITSNGGLTSYDVSPVVSEGVAGSDNCVSTDLIPNVYNVTNTKLLCVSMIRFM